MMTRDEIQQHLLSTLERKFDIKAPDPLAPLGDKYGLDSIDALELLMDLEATHGIVLTQTEKKELFAHRTVESIVNYIDQAMKSRMGAQV